MLGIVGSINVIAELPFPAIKRQDPGKYLEQRGFPGTVRPDQSYPVVTFQNEIKVVVNGIAIIGFRNVLEGNNVIAAAGRFGEVKVYLLRRSGHNDTLDFR